MHEHTDWVRTCRTLMATALVLCTVAEQSIGEIHWRRARVRTNLPPVCYGQDDQRVNDRIVTSKFTETQVVMVLDSPRISRLSAQISANASLAPAAPESILFRPGTAGTSVAPALPDPITVTTGPLASYSTNWIPGTPAESVIVRRRLFAPDQPRVFVHTDNVDLYQIGLAIYETGHLACTGKIKHTGGPDGIVKGNKVTIKVSGYGTNDLATPGPANGPLLFETTSTFWVAAGQDEAISLCQEDWCERVRRYFDAITYIEVKLTYPQDR